MPTTPSRSSSSSSLSPWRITPFQLRLMFGLLAVIYLSILFVNFRTTSTSQVDDNPSSSTSTISSMKSKSRFTAHDVPANTAATSNNNNNNKLPVSTLTMKLGNQATSKVEKFEPEAVAPNSTTKTTKNNNNKLPPNTLTKNILLNQRTTMLHLTKEELQHMEDPIQLHKELESFYSNFTTTTATTITNNNNLLWHNATYLPKWMKTYLNWHNYHRQKLLLQEDGEAAFDNYKYLIMQCIKGHDDHCGGTSDRLKPIPWSIRIAYYNRRLLFIHWNRPAKLTEFLVPPKGGFDWRVPDWLANQKTNNAICKLETDKYFGSKAIVERDVRAYARTNETLIRSRFQSFHAGFFWYDDQTMDGEYKSAELFHELWKISFTPSIAVRTAIENEMQRLHLDPGSYTGAHLRALYGKEDRAEAVKLNWAENAINCASEIRPKNPIFFTSDSRNATYYANMYGSKRNATIRTRVPNPNPPYHIDKVKNYKNYPPSDFYDTFIDLYILAQADCITYNKGGYGIFALLISRNWTCGIRQDALDRPKIREPCVWVDNVANGTNVTRDHYRPPNAIQSTFHNPVYYVETI